MTRISRPGVMSRAGWLLATAATVVGLLEFAYKYLDKVAAGSWPSPVPALVEELTAAYGAALLLGAGLPLVRRFPLRTGGLVRAVGALVPLMLLGSVLHTSLNWLSRTLIYAALGGHYNYGAMPARYLMELSMDLMVFSIFIGEVTAWDHRKVMNARELETARLHERLARAELRHLRGQLEPHFLFNALNAISERMYTDVAGADDMIGHLAALLRCSLGSGEASLVPLRTERALVGHYLALLQARFGNVLRIQMNFTRESLDVLVPPMLLQPLIENAVRHGGVGARGSGCVMVRAWCTPDRLRVEVRDDGNGMQSGSDPFRSGIGLSTARERLRLLYGDEQHLEAGNAPGGGFQVLIECPIRTGGPAEVECITTGPAMESSP